MFDVLTEDENQTLFAKLGSAGDKLYDATDKVMGDPEFGPFIRLWKDCNALRGELLDALNTMFGMPPAEPSAEFDLAGRYGYPA